MIQNKLAAPLDGLSAAFLRWREQRLADAPANHWQPACHQLQPGHDHALETDVLSAMCADIDSYGFTYYQLPTDYPDTTGAVNSLHRQLGLTDTDSSVLAEETGGPSATAPATGSTRLSRLENRPDTPDNRFLPYTNKAMNWHSDGYYNAPDEEVRSFTLYCVSQAARGGALTILDPHLLLIALYDVNPDAVARLSHPEAMTLPANKDELGHDRPDRHAAVFFSDVGGRLGTRFTMRQRNIGWRDQPTRQAMQQAVDVAIGLQQWHISLRLQPGQGLISRNVLHRREAFEDAPGQARRQMLRGRFLQYPQVQPDGAERHTGEPPAPPGLRY